MGLREIAPEQKRDNASLDGLDELLDGSSADIQNGTASNTMTGVAHSRYISNHTPVIEESGDLPLPEAIHRHILKLRGKVDLLNDLLKDANTRLDGASMLIGCQHVRLEQQEERLSHLAYVEARVDSLNEEVGEWINRCWQSDVQLVRVSQSPWYRALKWLGVDLLSKD